jgi:hypothetical protein
MNSKNAMVIAIAATLIVASVAVVVYGEIGSNGNGGMENDNPAASEVNMTISSFEKLERLTSSSSSYRANLNITNSGTDNLSLKTDFFNITSTYDLVQNHTLIGVSYSGPEYIGVGVTAPVRLLFEEGDSVLMFSVQFDDQIEAHRCTASFPNTCSLINNTTNWTLSGVSYHIQTLGPDGSSPRTGMHYVNASVTITNTGPYENFVYPSFTIFSSQGYQFYLDQSMDKLKNFYFSLKVNESRELTLLFEMPVYIVPHVLSYDVHMETVVLEFQT